MEPVSINGADRRECISEYHSSETMNEVVESSTCISNDDCENTDIEEHRKCFEELVIQLENEDRNKPTPFHSRDSMSTHGACARLVRLAVSLMIDKHGMHKLLKQLRQFFPSDCHLSKTIYRLLKMTGYDNHVKVPKISPAVKRKASIMIR